MPLSAMPVDEGIQAGIDRARAADLTAPDEVTMHATEVARGVVGGARVALSEAGESLFFELVTVAAIARHANRKEPLDERAIESYLEHTAAFFNSFFHA